MSSIFKRILLAIIAIPLLYLSIVILNFNNHLIFAILVITASFIGNYELYKMFDSTSRPYLIYYLPPLIPLSLYVFLSLNISLVYTVILAFILILITVIRASLSVDENSLSRITSTFFSIIYPNIGIIFILLILFTKQPIYLLLVVFVTVFANDSFAYIVGMLFGKNNKGYFKVSPNKSIAGFIGGLVFTILALYITNIIFDINQNIFLTILFGSLISIISNIGDLFESSLKRSANIKDSGYIMLGRGGILDSIDSLVFSVPVIYLIFILTGV